MYYFLALGACIREFSHWRKVIVVDDIHLHGKYEGVLLSPVAQDTENHTQEHYQWYCKVLQSCSSQNCMRNLDKNLRVNHHHGDSLYLYYNAAKAYSLEELNDHFAEFKDKSPEAFVVLEHEVGLKNWSRAHFPSNMYDVMTTNIAKSLNTMLIDEIEYLVAFIVNSIAKTFGELFRERHAHVLKSKGNKMVPVAERIARKK
ncbi:hypothetical protein KY290_007685 [Solanum tuberosum]|uniref:Uncharacterized protein n=1 Tax=Solanum tuberosum TaxID=4113 RepID=A0ABQ7W6E1_SOLTU|nr:hypothetical protein KY290_007685 [Solanum tuberosum]